MLADALIGAAKMHHVQLREGLSPTSSHVEPTTKLLNQHVKTMEKLCSKDGAEELLWSQSDYLSETEPMTKF